MKTREIVKNPEVPFLSPRAIGKITELCFRNDDVLIDMQEDDPLFVFGSQDYIEVLAVKIHQILDGVPIKTVILTGGKPEFDDSKDIRAAESELLMPFLQGRAPRVTFFKECCSDNMLDNVRFAIEEFPFMRNAKRIAFIGKSHSCGRGFLTLTQQLPKAVILQQSFDVSYMENVQAITRHNWWLRDFNRSRVWGEFLRIEKYALEGLIAYPEYVKSLIRSIRDDVSVCHSRYLRSSEVGFRSM